MSDDPTEQATEILVAHQRLNSQHCLCGWGELGKSHARHVAQALADAGLLPTEVERETRWVSLHTGEDAEEVHLRRYVTPWQEASGDE